MRGFPSLYMHLVAQVFYFTPTRIRTKDNGAATLSEHNIKTPKCASHGSRTQSLSSAPLTYLIVTEHAAVQTNMSRMNQNLAKGAQR